MNASTRKPEAADRRSAPSVHVAVQTPDYRDSILSSARSMPVVRYGVAALVFVGAAIIAWACLTWLSDLQLSGSMFDSTLVTRALTVVVVVGTVVLGLVGVLEFRRLRDRVKEGKGLIATPTWILGQTGKVQESAGSVEDDTEFETLEERELRQPENQTAVPTEVLTQRIAELHDEAAQRIQRFNGEMEQLFPRWQQRIQAYEDRVEELERELSAKESENSELVQRQIELVKQHLDIAREKVVEEERQEINEAVAAGSPATGPAEFVPVDVQQRAMRAANDFKQETTGLDEAGRIKAYERRIAEMESGLAGADAENRELAWNQLQIMQESLASLRSVREASGLAGNDGKGRGFHTEVRRRAALRVAELNERIARMHPDYEDRLGAYEERLQRLEAELRSKDAENDDLLRCQIEMSQNYIQLLKGDPGLPMTHSFNSPETVNKLFSLQYDLSDVQQEAAREVAAFNSRLHSVNPTRDEEVSAYRRRIAELEDEVARKDAENKDLYEAQLELVRHHLDVLGGEDNMPADGLCAQPTVDENGLPLVRIPSYQRANLKEELPREIKALLDRKPTALRIRRSA